MKVVLNARVKPGLKKKLEELAKREGKTISSIAASCLQEYLDNRIRIKNFDSIIEMEKGHAQIDLLLEIAREERLAKQHNTHQK